MPIYSHSKLSTFEQCPLKYKFKYIDYLKPDFENTIEAFLGKKVHDTLEWLYNNPNKEIIGLDPIIHHFVQDWNLEYNPDIKIISWELSVVSNVVRALKKAWLEKNVSFMNVDLDWQRSDAVAIQIKNWKPKILYWYNDNIKLSKKEEGLVKNHPFPKDLYHICCEFGLLGKIVKKLLCFRYACYVNG